jgi:hypothetical protein
VRFKICFQVKFHCADRTYRVFGIMLHSFRT